MHDRLSNGRKVRFSSVIDDFNREALFVEIDTSLKSQNVISVLNHLVKRLGKPAQIRVDSGPEFIAHATRDWSLGHGIELYRGLAEYFNFYNHQTPHQSLKYERPAVRFERLKSAA